MAAIHAQAFDRPWSPTEIFQMLDSPGVLGFLCFQEDPAGLLILRLAAGEAEVLTVAVAPWARRRGQARALMVSALGAARGLGADAVFLEVDDSNAAAIGLYGALGFTAVGLRRGYYDRGAHGRADARVMRLDLAPLSN
jgi:[ribosomal protein S18]-alanine N-acetyltransferase